MAGTRSSARQAAKGSPNSSQTTSRPSNGTTGTKRKSEASPPKAKRGKKSAQKEQKTIEETMPDKNEATSMKDVEMEEAKTEEVQPEAAIPGKVDSSDPKEDAGMDQGDADKHDPEDTGNNTMAEDKKDQKVEQDQKDQTNGAELREDKETANTNGISSKMDSTGKIESEHKAQMPEEPASNTDGDAVEVSSEREASTPSSLLEKGIIYFFFRGRVGIDDPSKVDELARSYIVLRPLPHGAKLGDGPIGDDGNNRLLALPKKVLPVSQMDKFMVFVDAAKSSIEDIKKNHLTSTDYVTQTAGARHTPAATPVAEGVYAITSTGRESHLAYIVTIPSELTDVQRDVGLRDRGSFVTSVKNPKYAGPANTNLPEGPGFPQEYVLF